MKKMYKLYISVVCLVLLVTTLMISNKAMIVKAYYEEQFNNFTSKSYVLLDSDSGTVLVSKNGSC